MTCQLKVIHFIRSALRQRFDVIHCHFLIHYWFTADSAFPIILCIHCLFLVVSERFALWHHHSPAFQDIDGMQYDSIHHPSSYGFLKSEPVWYPYSVFRSSYQISFLPGIPGLIFCKWHEKSALFSQDTIRKTYTNLSHYDSILMSGRIVQPIRKDGAILTLIFNLHVVVSATLDITLLLMITAPFVIYLTKKRKKRTKDKTAKRSRPTKDKK